MVIRLRKTAVQCTLHSIQYINNYIRSCYQVTRFARTVRTWFKFGRAHATRTSILQNVLWKKKTFTNSLKNALQRISRKTKRKGITSALQTLKNGLLQWFATRDNCEHVSNACFFFNHCEVKLCICIFSEIFWKYFMQYPHPCPTALMLTMYTTYMFTCTVCTSYSDKG